MPKQPGWRYCDKCKALHWAGGELGVCPRGGQHQATPSYHYNVTMDDPSAPGQPDWRFCEKCKVLHWIGGKPGICPGSTPPGGPHLSTVSSKYTLTMDDPSALGQPDWRYCDNCKALHWWAGGELGVCPKGGQHQATPSGKYTLDADEIRPAGPPPQPSPPGPPATFPFTVSKKSKVGTGMFIETSVKVSNTGRIDGEMLLTTFQALEGFTGGSVFLLEDLSGNVLWHSNPYTGGVNAAGTKKKETHKVVVVVTFPTDLVARVKGLHTAQGRFPKEIWFRRCEELITVGKSVTEIIGKLEGA